MCINTAKRSCRFVTIVSFRYSLGSFAYVHDQCTILSVPENSMITEFGMKFDFGMAAQICLIWHRKASLSSTT